MRILAIVLAVTAVCGTAHGQPKAYAVSGPARLFSTDALIVAETQPPLRLWGIDALEPGQTCWLGNVEWACFEDAYDTLEELIEGKTVTCEQRPDSSRLRRGKVYAVCKADGVDLSEAMVKAGYALALRDQSTDYVAAEQAAEKAAAGMWRSEFQPPWVWLQEQFGGR